MPSSSSSTTPSRRRSTTPSPPISLSHSPLRSPLPPMSLTPPAKQGGIGGSSGEGIGGPSGEGGAPHSSPTPPTTKEKSKSIKFGSFLGGSRLLFESSTPPVGDAAADGGTAGSADKKLRSVSRPAANEVAATLGSSSKKRRKTSNRPKPAPVPDVKAEEEIPQIPQQERCLLGDLLNRATGEGPHGELELGRFLWISDLDSDVSEHDIVRCFTSVSRVQAIELVRDSDSCAHLGCGLILFPSEALAMKVLNGFQRRDLPPMKQKKMDSYQIRAAHLADECNPRGFTNIDDAKPFPLDPDSPISL